MTARDRFVADEMLGKLAREMRALGYDVTYLKHVDDDEVLETARSEDRVLLTRDRTLADRAGDDALLIETRDPQGQLDHVLDQLDLSPDRSRFLSRCLDCNTELETTDAPEAVPDGVEDRQHWRCPNCGKIYWLGTHAKDMLDRFGPYLPEDRPSGPRDADG